LRAFYPRRKDVKNSATLERLDLVGSFPEVFDDLPGKEREGFRFVSLILDRWAVFS
jgi:hypothetical protein